MSKIKAISLFSSAGIGELLLNNTNVDVVAANELLPKRADCYKHFYPNTDMHCGDITLDETKEYMISSAKKSPRPMPTPSARVWIFGRNCPTVTP